MYVITKVTSTLFFISFVPQLGLVSSPTAPLGTYSFSFSRQVTCMTWAFFFLAFVLHVRTLLLPFSDFPLLVRRLTVLSRMIPVGWPT